MGRGYWTYHRTYDAGCCCGGPGCVLMLLTVPVWPLIGCFMTIVDKTPKAAPATIEKSTDEVGISISDLKTD